MYAVIEYLFAVNTQRTFLLMYVAHQPSVMRKNMYAHMCGVVISMCINNVSTPGKFTRHFSVHGESLASCLASHDRKLSVILGWVGSM